MNRVTLEVDALTNEVRDQVAALISAGDQVKVIIPQSEPEGEDRYSWWQEGGYLWRGQSLQLACGQRMNFRPITTACLFNPTYERHEPGKRYQVQSFMIYGTRD